MVENTCNDKCPFWKKYKENCMFYLETVWVSHDTSVPKTVKDCAPKRSLLLQMEVANRLTAVQKEANTEREAQHTTAQLLVEVIRRAQTGEIQMLSPSRLLADDVHENHD